VIGLEPETLFKTLDKYKVQVNKMPKFSNIFESYQSYVPGLNTNNVTQVAAPGQQQAQNTSIGNTTSFARNDGRAVISLNFNPYELDSK
jgi:hypothetical protein